MVEVGTRCVWFSISMNFTIGTNGDGQDSIVSDHNSCTIHDHSTGEFCTNKDNITTDSAGHIDFSKIGTISTDIAQIRACNGWFVQNTLWTF